MQMVKTAGLFGSLCAAGSSLCGPRWCLFRDTLLMLLSAVVCYYYDIVKGVTQQIDRSWRVAREFVVMQYLTEKVL